MHTWPGTSYDTPYACDKGYVRLHIFIPMLHVNQALLHTSTYLTYSYIYSTHIMCYQVVRACNPVAPESIGAHITTKPHELKRFWKRAEVDGRHHKGLPQTSQGAKSVPR